MKFYLNIIEKLAEGERFPGVLCMRFGELGYFGVVVMMITFGLAARGLFWISRNEFRVQQCVDYSVHVILS